MSDVELDPEEEQRRLEKKARKAAKKLARQQAEAEAEAAAAAEAAVAQPEKKKKHKHADDENEAAAAAPPEKKKKHQHDAGAAAAAEPAPAAAAAPVLSSKNGIRKSFYVAPASLASFSKDQVEAYRAQHFMTVSGSQADFPHFKPARSFAESGLPENVLKVCAGFKNPTPIQAQSWPIALSGRDAVGIAETGSGKTLAFTLPGVVHILAQAAIHPKKLGTPDSLGLVCTVAAICRAAHFILCQTNLTCV
jgi:ATP-dependent helicase YprA (DUF1998 family)